MGKCSTANQKLDSQINSFECFLFTWFGQIFKTSTGKCDLVI